MAAGGGAGAAGGGKGVLLQPASTAAAMTATQAKVILEERSVSREFITCLAMLCESYKPIFAWN
jgi:hypothetical protein